MDDLLAIVLEYGYVLLFAFVSAEQIGLPVPAVPVLRGVGALAGRGRMSIALALGIALMASLPPDIVWYELGRRARETRRRPTRRNRRSIRLLFIGVGWP